MFFLILLSPSDKGLIGAAQGFPQHLPAVQLVPEPPCLKAAYLRPAAGADGGETDFPPVPLYSHLSLASVTSQRMRTRHNEAVRSGESPIVWLVLYGLRLMAHHLSACKEASIVPASRKGCGVNLSISQFCALIRFWKCKTRCPKWTRFHQPWLLFASPSQ